VARTSILTVNDHYEGRIDRISSGVDIEQQLREDYPGLKELDIGLVQHEVAHDKFFVVEKWDTIESMQDGLLPSFVKISNIDSIEDIDQSLDLHTSVRSAVCSSLKTGDIRMKSKNSCASLWKVTGPPENCAWIPGCKYMKTSSTSALARVYLEDGTMLNAITTSKRGTKKIKILADDHHLGGFSSVLSLKKLGWGHCEVRHAFQNGRLAAQESSHATFRVFHEHFVPDLHLRVTNK